MASKTATTEQGIEVDASIVDFISHLNSCGWLKTSESCSGVKADHDGKFHLPYIGFYSKNEGPFAKNPAPEDIELLDAIQQAGWFQRLHFRLPYAEAYPKFIAHTPNNISIDKELSTLRKDYIARLFARSIEDTPDEETIEKWKDLVSALSTEFCPEKNPYPDRTIPLTKPGHRRRNKDAMVNPEGLPKSTANEIYEKLLELL